MNTIVAAILLCGSLAGMQPARFSFAGLDLGVTIKDLRLKYPRSQVLDEGLVYLSEKDSHDHISTIGLSGIGSGRRLQINFERRQQDSKATYPPCQKVLSGLEQRYGRPTRIVDGQEEQSRNRRFEWNTSAETLTLSCFRMPRQPLYAESITIASKG